MIIRHNGHKDYKDYSRWNGMDQCPSSREWQWCSLLAPIALVTDAISALGKLGYHDLTAADLVRLIPPDEFDVELQVMAFVRSYFQIAYTVSSTSFALN